MIVGNIADYAVTASLHLEATGNNIFGHFPDPKFAVTNSSIHDNIVTIGSPLYEEREDFHISNWYQSYSWLEVLPLLVPGNQTSSPKASR